MRTMTIMHTLVQAHGMQNGNQLKHLKMEHIHITFQATQATQVKVKIICLRISLCTHGIALHKIVVKSL